MLSVKVAYGQWVWCGVWFVVLHKQCGVEEVDTSGGECVTSNLMVGWNKLRCWTNDRNDPHHVSRSRKYHL